MRLRIFLAILWISIGGGLIGAQGLPPVAPGAVSGDILIAGSRDTGTLVETLASAYRSAGFSGTIVFDPSDSASGIRRFCLGETDIASADRLINPQELNDCSAAGRSNVLGFRIGVSALVVAVNPGNTFLQDLSTSEVQAVFSTALNWSDVRPDFPNEPIRRFVPGQETAAFRQFTDLVYLGNTTPVLTAIGAQFASDPGAVLLGVQNDVNAIGLFPAAFFSSNSGGLRAISINGAQANAERISSGAYLLASPLVLLTDARLLREQPQIADFINFAVSSAAGAAPSLGFFVPGAEAQATNTRLWLDATGQPGVAQAPEAPAPIVTEEAPLVEAPPPAQPAFQGLFEPATLTEMVNARADLELLALNSLGIDRPEGWSGSLELENPQLPLLIRLDLELLVGILQGETVRPVGWFGPVPGPTAYIVRDIRHDLELVADVYFGANERPSGWAGPANPLMRCNRATQTLVALLLRGGLFTPSADPASPTFCADIETQASAFSEGTLLALPIERPVFSAEARALLPGAYSIDTEFAVAFFDRGASINVGVVPFGTPLSAIGRSVAQFSKMTLIEGEGFRVYVDWRDTTLTEEQFNTLPDAASLNAEPFCTARWCR